MKKTSFNHEVRKLGHNRFEITWIQMVKIARGETIPVKYRKKTNRDGAERFAKKHQLYFHDAKSKKETQSQRRRRYYLHQLMSKVFEVDAYSKTVVVHDSNLLHPVLKKHGAELISLGYNLQTQLDCSGGEVCPGK